MATALITYRYLGQQRTSINLPPETEGGVSPVVDLIPHELVELPAGFEYAERGLRTGLLELVEPAEQTSKNRRVKPEEAS